MSKIDNNFSNPKFSQAQQNPTSSPNRVFGEFLSPDAAIAADYGQFAGLMDAATDRNDDAPASDDALGNILGDLESRPETDDPRSDRQTSNRAKSRPAARRSEHHQPADEAKRAHLRYRGIGEKEVSPFDQQLTEQPAAKLKDPLAPFSVPLLVDRLPLPNLLPIEKPASTTAVRAEMIEQIVQEVRLGINETGAAEFQFDLKSEVLAGLKLKISTQDGQISATFIAENVHIKDTLDQSAPELIQALQDRGLAVANVQVAVGSDAGSGNQHQSGQEFTGGDSSQQQQSSTADYDNNTDFDQSPSRGYPNNTRSTTDYTI
jgi:flagellar hook-length control protein FliK